MPEEVSSPAWNLESLRRGNQGAWRVAFVELWRIAFGVISPRVFSKHAAEDLAQEAVTIVASSLNKFADERHMRVMTGIIARRKAAHFQRDETAGKRDRRLEVGVEAASNVEAAQSSTRLALDLETVLARLDPVDRALLEGYFVTGLKSHELAKIHGLNASTVRGRIRTAMGELKMSHGDSVGIRTLALLLMTVTQLAGFAPVRNEGLT